MNRFILFDVETPNYNNDRMSALGITVVENGRIVEERYYLINPECRFDRFNVWLTGITPAMVRNKPTFADLWPELEPLFSSGLLMAHNAPFDMGVLAKCLSHYGILWKSEVRYACTCRMGRRLMPDLPDHKLNTMCAHLGIGLNHHNAASDSRACAELLLRYLSQGAAVEDFTRIYDMHYRRTIRED